MNSKTAAKTVKQAQELRDEMLVHGAEAALAVLGKKHSAAVVMLALQMHSVATSR